MLPSLGLNLSSGMQRYKYSTSLVGFGGAGSAEDMQGNLCEVPNSVMMLFYFAEGDFILNLCSVSSLQCSGRRNWTAARDLQRYRNHYPVRAPGAAPHHFCLQEHFLDLGAPFCLCFTGSAPSRGFICEGEGMICLWVHQKQAATFQSTF